MVGLSGDVNAAAILERENAKDESNVSVIQRLCNEDKSTNPPPKWLKAFFKSLSIFNQMIRLGSSCCLPIAVVPLEAKLWT
ncbi:hypothetical protein VP01_3499g1, partial [Puccinia sorghi]